jgi:hypothetical protein
MAENEASVLRYGVDFGTNGYTLSYFNSTTSTVDLLVNELSSRKTPIAGKSCWSVSDISVAY